MEATKSSIKHQVTSRIFVGCLFTSEIRMYLVQNIAWKQAKISATMDSDKLVEVHYEGKDYLGRYIDASCVTLEYLEKMGEEIVTAIHNYCHQVSKDSLKYYIFSQLFVI